MGDFGGPWGSNTPPVVAPAPPAPTSYATGVPVGPIGNSASGDCPSSLFQMLQYRSFIGKNAGGATLPWVLSDRVRSGYFWWVLNASGHCNFLTNNGASLALYLLPPGVQPDVNALVAGVRDPYFGDANNHGPLQSGVRVSPSTTAGVSNDTDRFEACLNPNGPVIVPAGWALLAMLELTAVGAGLLNNELRLAFLELPFGSDVPNLM